MWGWLAGHWRGPPGLDAQGPAALGCKPDRQSRSIFDEDEQCFAAPVRKIEDSGHGVFPPRRKWVMTAVAFRQTTSQVVRAALDATTAFACRSWWAAKAMGQGPHHDRQ